MGIDLDYDTDLTGDAESFGIENLNADDSSTHPPAGSVPPANSATTVDGITSLDAAVALAMDVCQWDYTFYSWCDEYLHGIRQEAMLDVPLMRFALEKLRNYWGPLYFTHDTKDSRGRYYAIMAAQAALSATERRNKEPLIQKVIYYASMVKESWGM